MPKREAFPYKRPDSEKKNNGEENRTSCRIGHVIQCVCGKRVQGVHARNSSTSLRGEKGGGVRIGVG
jgi:hypothetical protein